MSFLLIIWHNFHSGFCLLFLFYAILDFYIYLLFLASPCFLFLIFLYTPTVILWKLTARLISLLLIAHSGFTVILLSGNTRGTLLPESRLQHFNLSEQNNSCRKTEIQLRNKVKLFIDKRQNQLCLYILGIYKIPTFFLLCQFVPFRKHVSHGFHDVNIISFVFFPTPNFPSFLF